MTKLLKQLITFSLLSMICIVNLSAQQISDTVNQQNKILIQLSGSTLMSNQGDYLPYVSVSNLSSGEKAVSTNQGVYSIIVNPGDTIRYSFVGFSPQTYIVPRLIYSPFLMHNQLLTVDTFYLPETLIRPLPSKERFEYEFVYGELENDVYERARQNTEYNQLMFLATVLSKDGGENASSLQKTYVDRLKTYQQAPSMPVLSPQAWAEFVDMLFNKRKKK